MPDPEDLKTPEGEQLTLSDLMDNSGENPRVAEPPAPVEKVAAAAEEAETPERKAEREATEAAAAKPDKLAGKTPEELREIYADAERRMHEATTKAAEEKAAREALEARIAELEAAAKPPEKPVEEAKPVISESRKKALSAAYLKAMSVGRNLDRNAEDYDKQISDAFGEALAEAGVGGVSQEEIDQTVSKRVQESLKAAREAEAKERSELTAQDESTRAYNTALDLAKKSGLNMEEDAADRIMFDALAAKMPDELRNKGVEAVQEKVDWVVDKVKQKLGRVVEQTEEQRQAALLNQNKNKVLGKGADFSTSKEPPKPRTLSEIMDQIHP